MMPSKSVPWAETDFEDIIIAPSKGEGGSGGVWEEDFASHVEQNKGD